MDRFSSFVIYVSCLNSSLVVLSTGPSLLQVLHRQCHCPNITLTRLVLSSQGTQKMRILMTTPDHVCFLLFRSQKVLTLFLLMCIFFCQKPWLGPGQARAKPSVAALAGPMISAGQSRLKPSQSRGFWAKPGQANH